MSLNLHNFFPFNPFATLFVDQQSTAVCIQQYHVCWPVYGDTPCPQYCRIKKLSTQESSIYNVLYEDVMNVEIIVYCLCLTPYTLPKVFTTNFPFGTIEYLSLGGEGVKICFPI